MAVIRILVTANWAHMGSRVWNLMPDDTEWPFFQAHTNVGDIVTVRSRSQLDCTYEILSKDPVPDHG